MQIQSGVKTKIHEILITGYSYYRRKLSELMVLNIEILIPTIFFYKSEIDKEATKL